MIQRTPCCSDVKASVLQRDGRGRFLVSDGEVKEKRGGWSLKCSNYLMNYSSKTVSRMVGGKPMLDVDAQALIRRLQQTSADVSLLSHVFSTKSSSPPF